MTAASHVRRRLCLLVGVTTASLTLLGQTQAQADPPPTTVNCGDVITQSTVVANDIGPCPDHGLVIGASGITLDINGHTIRGDNTGPGAGDDAGVYEVGFSNVKITNGKITRFDAGVDIEGGSGNNVSRLIATNNQSTGAGDFGDGIAIFASTNNQVHDNVVSENGPYSGVSLISSAATGNTVRGNSITENDVLNQASGVRETDGVRVEFGRSNVVHGNVVKRNGLDGVAVFFNSTDNVVTSNVVNHNGFHPGTQNRPGDGIRVFLQGDRTLVRNNDVFRNAEYGIDIDSKSNQIINNRTGGNGPGDLFDLLDTNTDGNCDANVWRGNTFDTAFPACTQG